MTKYVFIKSNRNTSGMNFLCFNATATSQEREKEVEEVTLGKQYCMSEGQIDDTARDAYSSSSDNEPFHTGCSESSQRIAAYITSIPCGLFFDYTKNKSPKIRERSENNPIYIYLFTYPVNTSSHLRHVLYFSPSLFTLCSSHCSISPVSSPVVTFFFPTINLK